MRTMFRQVLLSTLLVVGLVACDTATPSDAPAKSVAPPPANGQGKPVDLKLDTSKAQFRSSGPLNYCDVFECKPCDPAVGPCPPAGSASVIFCCNSDGICVNVDLMSACGPYDYVVVCRWGQSNADGTITCYE